MNAWRQLLLQPVLRHRAGGRMWVTWTLLAALLLPLAGAASGRVPGTVAGLAAGAIAGTLSILWLSLFVQTAMRLNTPAAACLVPGMRRRLMTLVAILWPVAFLPPAALFGAATGHFGYTLLVCAAILQYVVLCGRYPWLGFAPSFGWLVTRLPGFPREQLAAALEAPSEPALAAGGLVILAASGAAVLRVLLPRGGDAHYDVEACLARQARRRSEGRAEAFGPWLYRLLDGVYHARLRVPGRSASRLLDALGPRAHWGGAVLIIVMLTAGTLAWRMLAGPADMRPFVPLLLVSMLLVVVTHVDGLLSAIKKSRVEQGILCLAPVAPRPRDLNRALALALLRRFGAVFGTYLVCSTVVMMAMAGAWRAWLCCTVLALAFAPLLLRDHARRPGWAGAQVVAGALLLVMAPLSGIVEYGKVPFAAVAACLLLLLAGTAVASVLAWRRVLAAPLAFPAGRMAD